MRFSSTRTPRTNCPPTCKWIVDIAAKETQLWSYTWINGLNAEAIRLFKEKVEFVQMDKETMIDFRKLTKTYFDELKAKYPDVKKVLDSQEAFLADFADWREARSGATPWPMTTTSKASTRNKAATADKSSENRPDPTVLDNEIRRTETIEEET